MSIKTSKKCLRMFATNAKKVVLMTGCDTGLGFSAAHKCLKQGVHVVAGCLDTKSQGAKQLQNIGVDVQHLDVTDTSSVASAATHVANMLKDPGYVLHAVVNNAGVMVFGEFEWQTSKLISQQVTVNLIGSFTIAHQFLPLLRVHKGRLVNIVSHCALVGLPCLSVYGATKAAMLNWNDTLRIEQSKYGVQVISFIPGSFYGQSGIMARQSEHAQEMLRNMSAESRKWHEPYFNKVQHYLSLLPSPKGPQLLEDEALYSKLLDALFSTNPCKSYKHEPLRYTIYHSLFKITPVWLRDYLIERFVSLPKYEK